jgi:hypothetical protein
VISLEVSLTKFFKMAANANSCKLARGFRHPAKKLEKPKDFKRRSMLAVEELLSN